MNANEYQQAASRTLISNDEAPTLLPIEIRIIWNAMGLAGEAGEFVDAAKKMVLHGHGLDVDKLAEELGDVLWYVAAECSVLGLSMGAVMARNLAKLQARYPDGWDPAKSQQRDEAAEQLALLPAAPQAAQLALPAEPGAA